MQTGIMLSVVMLNILCIVIMLKVVMLSVMAPLFDELPQVNCLENNFTFDILSFCHLTFCHFFI